MRKIQSLLIVSMMLSAFVSFADGPGTDTGTGHGDQVAAAEKKDTGTAPAPEHAKKPVEKKPAPKKK